MSSKKGADRGTVGAWPASHGAIGPELGHVVGVETERVAARNFFDVQETEAAKGAASETIAWRLLVRDHKQELEHVPKIQQNSIANQFVQHEI